MQTLRRALGRIAAFLGGLLPAPGPDDPPPPDIDGRRPAALDDTDVKMRSQARDGRGAGSNQ